MIHIAVAALSMTTMAHAADATAPQAWDGQAPQRFHIESHAVLPDQVEFPARRNSQAWVHRYELRANTTCATTAVRKRRTTVTCTVDEAVLSGTAGPAFDMVLGGILKQYGELLTGTSVELSFRTNGTLAAVDINGLPRDTPRDARVQNVLEAVAAQAFAGFDFEAPTGASTWTQANPRTAAHLNPQGAVSRSSLAHTVNNDSNGVLTIQATGESSVGIRGTMEGNQTAGELFVLGGTTGSHTLWDDGAGTLLTRTWWTHLESTASAPRMQRPMLAPDKDGHSRQVYSVAGLVVQIPDGTAFPALGKSTAGVFGSQSAQLVDAHVLGESAGEVLAEATALQP